MVKVSADGIHCADGVLTEGWGTGADAVPAWISEDDRLGLEGNSEGTGLGLGMVELEGVPEEEPGLDLMATMVSIGGLRPLSLLLVPLLQLAVPKRPDLARGEVPVWITWGWGSVFTVLEVSATFSPPLVPGFVFTDEILESAALTLLSCCTWPSLSSRPVSKPKSFSILSTGFSVLALPARGTDFRSCSLEESAGVVEETCNSS